MKYIEQLTTSECGLACLAMIMSEYKVDCSMTKLRSQWQVGRDGLTFRDIKKIANYYGLNCKGIRTNDIKLVEYPGIIYNGENHFLVVKSVKNEVMTIFDPANGIYKGSIQEVCGSDDVLMLIFSQNENRKSIESAKRDTNRLKTYKYVFNLLSKFKGGVIAFFTLATLVQLLNLSGPILIQEMINQVIRKESIGKDKLLELIGLVVIFPVIFICRIRVSNYLKVKIDSEILLDFVYRIIRMPYRFFISFNKDDIVYRYNSSIILREIFSEQLFSLWINIGTALVSIVYMFTQSILIAITLVAIVLIQAIFYLTGYHRKKYLAGREMREQSKALSIFMDTIDAIKLIKGNSLEDSAYLRWEKVAKKYWNMFRIRTNYNGKIDTINSSLMTLVPILIAMLSMLMVTKGELSVGSILSMYILTTYVVSPMTQLFSVIDEIVYGNTYLENMLEIHESELEELFESKEFNSDSINVDVNNVYYRYSKLADYTLQKISFTIHQGDFIGIVGESGSGKSTLGLLLVGLLKATEGRVSVDGDDINLVNKYELRKKIGIVQQNPSFIKGSIAENIMLMRKPNKEKLIAATKKAEIFDFIKKLPMGFATPIDNKDLISGGELQRLEIARALYNDPKLILFDEATSSLDSIVEKKVYENIKSLHATRIVITHDLNTTIDADKIIVLKDGKIVGLGNHQQLMKENDYYVELFEKFINMEG